ARGRRRLLSLLRLPPEGRPGDGRGRLGGQEEGPAPGLRRSGEPRAEPAQRAGREVPALGAAEQAPEGDPREEVRGGPQAGQRRSERPSAEPLRQRVASLQSIPTSGAVERPVPAEEGGRSPPSTSAGTTGPRPIRPPPSRHPAR